MSHIFRVIDNQYWPTTDGLLQVAETLPPKVYTVMFDVLKGFYLSETEPFSLPPKLYGKTNSYADRVLTTFADPTREEKMLGVLLAGEKGSGKTLLAKTICIKSGLPVLIVNAPYTSDDFLKLIHGIGQRVIVFFDEFEKSYSEKKAQESMLTLFDGVYSSKPKLLLCTVNNKWDLREYFHNRPGRLYYNISFEGVTTDFIREYCEDMLADKSRVEEIIKTALSCGTFNFDMLQALVSELNRYPQDTIEAVLEVLNVKPYSMQNGTTYTVDVVSPSHPHLVWRKFCGVTVNPLTYMLSKRDNITIHCQTNVPNKVPKVDETDYDETITLSHYLILTKDDLKKVSEDGTVYSFEVTSIGDTEGYEGTYSFQVVFTPESKAPIFGKWEMGRFT
jgi:hypothetical protein